MPPRPSLQALPVALEPWRGRQSVCGVPQIALIFLGLGRSLGLRVKVLWCKFPWAAPFSEAGGALHTLPGLVLLGLPYFVLPPLCDLAR